MRYDLFIRWILISSLTAILLYLVAEWLWFFGYDFTGLHAWSVSPRGITQKWILVTGIFCVLAMLRLMERVDSKGKK